MRQDGLAGTVTADLEYPPRVAFVLLTQVSRVERGVINLLVHVDHVMCRPPETLTTCLLHNDPRLDAGREIRGNLVWDNAIRWYGLRKRTCAPCRTLYS